MLTAEIPKILAQEPSEEACQPQQAENVMSPPQDHGKPKKNITFAEGTQSTEVSSSQNTCSFKDALSQPGPGLSQKQRLLWLQKRRNTGLWVQCDGCNRWRYLSHVLDSHELPKRWYCKMNPDRSAADCSVPEKPINLREEEDLIHSEYSTGSVVWARLAGWPWWPAMVDDCPDAEQFYWLDGFSDIPTHYNVVFFDAFEVTRAWISPENLKPYNANKNTFKHVAKDNRYKKRMEVAIRQADDADMLPLTNRLNKYSFINRYKGNIGDPKKISKKNIEKFKKQIKRQLNIDFSDESDTDSVDSSYSEPRNISPKRRAMKNKNVILVGTPKNRKEKRAKVEVSVKEKANVTEIATDDITHKKANGTEIATDDITHKKANGTEIATDDIIDTTNVIEPVIENNNRSTELETTVEVERANDYFKQPNSMTVQISCTPALDTMNIDNDSSKTYVPDSLMSQRSTDVTQTETDFQDLEVRIASPSSDDFEF